MDPAGVDLRLHSDYVLERVMSRGGWEAMRWLREVYPAETLAGFIVRKGARLSPRERAYWSLIAGLPVEVDGVDDIPRGGARPPWAGP